MVLITMAWFVGIVIVSGPYTVSARRESGKSDSRHISEIMPGVLDRIIVLPFERIVRILPQRASETKLGIPLWLPAWPLPRRNVGKDWSGSCASFEALLGSEEW